MSTMQEQKNNDIKGLFELTIKNVLWLILIYVELLAVAYMTNFWAILRRIVII